MEFNSNFREWLGRTALNELKQLYPNLFKYRIFFTDGKYDPYDAHFYIINEKGEILKNVKIEIKIRDKSFPTYILEKKKLDSIRKRCEVNLKDNEYVILYLNFTPDGTYLWNITNLNTDNTSIINANKATSSSRTHKIDKEVIYLDPKTSKSLNYVLDTDKLLRRYKRS